MSGISNAPKSIWEKLRIKEYRDSYVASHVRRWVSRQIRVLREQPERNWKQGELALRLGKPQSVVSRLEDPSYGNMTINTLLEVASALDVALIVKFVSFSRFKYELSDLREDSMNVKSFNNESKSVSFSSESVTVNLSAAYDKSVIGYFVHSGGAIDVIDNLNLDNTRVTSSDNFVQPTFKKMAAPGVLVQ